MTALRNRIGTGIAGFVVLAALVLGIMTSGGSASAAETMYGPYDDGCYYSTDGYSWTGKFCDAGNGWMYFYAPGYGTWDYAGLVGSDGAGGIWYQTPDNLTQYHISVYGQVTYYDLSGSSTVSTSTSISKSEAQLKIDQMIFDANARMIDTILAPACNSSYNGCA